MAEQFVSRRLMLKRSMAIAAGAFLGVGCTPRTAALPPPPATQQRRLARVLVSPERVVRTVAGLRPFRPSGFVVRAERLGEKQVVHNYGHGGGGISLSWGSAALAVDQAVQTGASRYAVAGCGVMGLSTARLLQDRGFEVTIYAKELPPNTTSNVAGAHWSPFSVHTPGSTTPEYDQQFERAARFSYHYFQNLIGDSYGVRWLENYILSTRPPAAAPMGAISDLFPGTENLAPDQHPFDAPYVRRQNAMFIEPAIYLNALTRDFLLRGGRIVVREFHDLRELVALPEPVICNCTGLGSRALFGDEELIPIRGELVILLPQPEVDYVMMSREYYMFPRQDGIVLGGSRERNVWSMEPNPAVVSRILEGHRAVFEKMRG